MDWLQSTDATKAIVAENDMRNRIRQSCLQRWIKAIDITPELLREKWVLDTNRVMDVVVKLICEFYGINMWELSRNSREFLMDKYWIPEDKLNILYNHGNIELAYTDFVRHHYWDWKQPDDVKLDPLPTTTTVVDLPEEKVKQEEDRMLRVWVDNLKQMLAVETDPDKKELYEAQLKVLELKLKNANAW